MAKDIQLNKRHSWDPSKTSALSHLCTYSKQNPKQHYTMINNSNIIINILKYELCISVIGQNATSFLERYF